MASYLLQEDGVGKFTLEDGSGFILLEDGTVPVVPVEPIGGRIIQVAPRRRIPDKRRRRGRFLWTPASIHLYAPTPFLEVQFASGRAILGANAAEIHTRISFAVHPARANARYWKDRTSDSEERIRKVLIAELFDRDDHNARERGP